MRGHRQGACLMTQVVGQVVGGGKPLRGAFRQRLEADALQSLRDGVVHLSGRAGLDRGDLVEKLGHRLAPEGASAGEQFVEDDAETEDVGAPIHAVPLAARLLGAHVGGGAGKPGSAPEVFLAQGQAEVGDVGVAGPVEQKVGGLDVPVD